MKTMQLFKKENESKNINRIQIKAGYNFTF